MMNNNPSINQFDIGLINGLIKTKLNWPEVNRLEMQEGGTKFSVADADTIYDAPAFFNPVMVLNRDISILFCDLYGEKVDHKLRVIEPLAGIGIRGIRLAKSLNSISEVIINDFDEITTKIACVNRFEQGCENIVKQFKRDANSLLAELGERNFKFHYLDLDPFGPPVGFIDNIWQVLSLSAMISITATDMTALCGVYPDACLRKYGSIPLNNFHTHETACRILIATIVQSAARHGYGLKPIFTLSADHYAKVFFETRKGRGEANNAVKQIGYSFTCDECMQIYFSAGLQSSEPKCCGTLDKAGPLWVGNLFSPSWCENALKKITDYLLNSEQGSYQLPSAKRLEKIIREGLHGYDLPGYYPIDMISSKLHLTQPKFQIFKDVMEKEGYRVVATQFRKQSFRTDAPIEKTIEIFSQVVTTMDMNADE